MMNEKMKVRKLQNRLAIGDVVRLKSGGRLLTVIFDEANSGRRLLTVSDGEHPNFIAPEECFLLDNK